jgi:hypothetical protein
VRFLIHAPELDTFTAMGAAAISVFALAAENSSAMDAANANIGIAMMNWKRC